MMIEPGSNCAKVRRLAVDAFDAADDERIGPVGGLHDDGRAGHGNILGRSTLMASRARPSRRSSASASILQRPEADVPSL